MPELTPTPINLPQDQGPLFFASGTPRAATVLTDPLSPDALMEPTPENARAILDAYYLAATDTDRATTWSRPGEDSRVSDKEVALGASRRAMTRRIGNEFRERVNYWGDSRSPDNLARARFVDTRSREWMPLFLQIANEDLVSPIDVEDAMRDAVQAARDAKRFGSKDVPESERVADFYKRRFGDFVSLDQMVVSEHPELAGVALAGLFSLMKAGIPTGVPSRTDEETLFFDKAATAVTERRNGLFKNDLLTDIPTRDRGDTIAADLILEARKQGHDVATLFFDLNRFKSIQEKLDSHTAGDRLLKDVASALKELHGIRPWRQGGDEFAGIMLPYAQPKNPVDGKTIEPAGVADLMDTFYQRLEQKISESIAKNGYRNEHVSFGNLSDFDNYVRANIFDDVEGAEDMSLGQLLVSAGARILRPDEEGQSASSAIGDADHQVFSYKKRKFGSRDKPRERSNNGLAIEELRNVIVAYAA